MVNRSGLLSSVTRVDNALGVWLALALFPATAVGDPFSDEPGPAGRKFSFTADVSIVARYNDRNSDSDVAADDVDSDSALAYFDLVSDWDLSQTLEHRGRVAVKVSNENDDANELTLLENYISYLPSSGDLSFSLGRQRLNWSAGFQWTPMNILEPRYVRKDYDRIDIFQQRGWDMWTASKAGSRLTSQMVIASSGDAKYVSNGQYALRLSYSGKVDLDVAAAVIGDYSRIVGASTSVALPWNTMLSVESAHRWIDGEKSDDPDLFATNLESITGRDRFFETLVGITKYFEGGSRLGLEYYYNGRGVTDEDDLIRRIAEFAAANPLPSARISETLSNYEYFRNYLSVYGHYQTDSAGSYLLSRLIYNVDDESYFASFSFYRSIGRRFAIEAEIGRNSGPENSEYSLAPVKNYARMIFSAALP